MVDAERVCAWDGPVRPDGGPGSGMEAKDPMELMDPIEPIDPIEPLPRACAPARRLRGRCCTEARMAFTFAPS